MIIYFNLLLFFPKIFTASFIVSYIFFIFSFICLMAFNQFKNDFFLQFKNDHFFNLLSKKQSEYINETINFNTNELLLRYFIPLLLPIMFHLLIFKKLYFIIILFPLVLAFFKLILPYFIFIYLHIKTLAKEYFLLKIFLIFSYSTFLGIIIIQLTITAALVVKDFINLKLSNNLLFYLSCFLFIINLFLFLLRRIPKTIISQNYKRFIYAEGNKRNNKKVYHYPFLQKLISFGMAFLDSKEKAIYQKDLKNILRNKNARISMIIIGLIMTITLGLFGIFSPLRKINGFNLSDIMPLYFFLNTFIIYALGYFMLIHKYISSFSAEGYNHLLYQKVKINYYQVYKTKLFFNRFFILFPFIPFFIILLFSIRNLDGLLLYIISLLYFWGVVNLVIKLEILEDFFQPRFNGQIKNEKYIQQNYLNNYLSFIVIAFLLLPLIFREFSHINILYLFLILLGIIYLVNIIIYRKSLVLKKAKVISYGGIEIA